MMHALEIAEGVRKGRRDLSGGLDCLPFGREYSTVGGLLLLHHLDGGGASRTALNEAFPSCVDPHSDLRRGLELWRQIHAAVLALAATDDAAVPAAVRADFEQAHALLTALPAHDMLAISAP